MSACLVGDVLPHLVRRVLRGLVATVTLAPLALCLAVLLRIQVLGYWVRLLGLGHARVLGSQSLTGIGGGFSPSCSCETRTSSTERPANSASFSASFLSMDSCMAKCSKSSGWLYDSSVWVSGVLWNCSVSRVKTVPSIDLGLLTLVVEEEF
jgi:hypothetical protein